MGLPVKWERFETYLLYHAHRKRETLSTCKGVFCRIKQYFTTRDLTEDNIYSFFEYLKSKGDKNSTINNYLKYLHHLGKILNLKWLMEIKYLPVEEQIFDTLTPDEIRKILTCHTPRQRDEKEINNRYDIIIETLLATGMRREEVCALTWNDLHEDRLIIRTSKNKTGRASIINRELSQKIQALPHYTEYIFGSKKGRLIAAKINEELKKRTDKLGIRKTITCHSLRRTAATESARKGINLAYIQRFLGHKSINTTSKYIQVDEMALEAVSRSLTVNEGSINMEDVYVRLKHIAQEFIPNFKVELKKTKSGVRLFIAE